MRAYLPAGMAAPGEGDVTEEKSTVRDSTAGSMNEDQDSTSEHREYIAGTDARMAVLFIRTRLDTRA